MSIDANGAVVSTSAPLGLVVGNAVFQAPGPDVIFAGHLLGWWRADMGVTSDVNGVSAWANQGSLGGSLAQADNAKKPHTGILRGQAALEFDGGDVLVSSLAASDFTFLSNGSGSTIIAVYRVSVAAGCDIMTTSNAGNLGVNTTGFELLNTSTQVQYIMSKGSVAHVTAQVGRTGQGVALYVDIIRTKTGGSPAEYGGIHNGKNVTAAFANAVSAGAPNFTLYVGGSPSGNLYLTGKLSEIMLVDQYVTDAQVDQSETYLGERLRYSPDAGQ